MKLMILGLLLCLPAFAAKKISREGLTDRIEYACNVRVKAEHKNHRAICACVSRNLESKLGTADLELIARSHEEEKKAEEELQKEEHNDLILFDFEVTESCLENPEWSHSQD